MQKNITLKLKRKMQAGEPVFTAIVGPGNDPPETVQAMQSYGFDFIIVDREHALINQETVYAYVIAGKEMGIPIFLRPEENFAHYRSYLDSGISGLYLGMVNTVEQAAYAVQQTYFPPIGHRGTSIGTDPYLIDFQSPKEVPYLDLIEYVNNNTIILACVESLPGISNLPNILRLEGITGTIVATNDLMLDVACTIGDAPPGALLEERLTTDFMVTKFQQVAGICRQAGKVCGVGGLKTPENFARRVKEGYRVFMLGSMRDGEVEKLRPLIEETRARVIKELSV
jgi:2-keto-3-deoxy-L-rhamnonate aldolase RhmA